jgi:hypothetical protein
MQRTYITVLNFVLIIVGLMVIYSSPLSSLAITLGMFLISASIISFTILIYFPPSDRGYVKLRVVETPKVTSFKTVEAHKKSKRVSKGKKKPKRKRK